MSDPVCCEKCGTIGPRRLMRRAPDGWLFFEAKIADSTDTIIVTVCSKVCADALWSPGPGERWTPEEMQFAGSADPTPQGETKGGG